jgi:transcriptional regulator of arginine metabolism
MPSRLYIPVVDAKTSGLAGRGARRAASAPAAKDARQRLVHDLVASHPVRSQREIVALLTERGVDVTQATVSRDIAELGLVKVASDGRHVYASADDLGHAVARGRDDRLRRVLADYPVRVGRSGLTLLLLSEAGTAGAIGQAIDESTLQEQEGTLAGDNTILVLFADETRLETWLARFEALRRTVPAKGRGHDRKGR